jgi:hypothetical protein
MQFLIGFILGIAVATVGFAGVAKVADKGIEATKAAVTQVAK